jgi:hypothetical protein
LNRKEIKKKGRKVIFSGSPSPPCPAVPSLYTGCLSPSSGQPAGNAMIVAAAAPAPPVPAPPGKPPFSLSSSSSSLRRRSFSLWFSNGNAHGRDSATATTSSRATRRWWWSDPGGSREDYGSSSLEEEDSYAYEDEAAFPGFGGAAELFDEPWFSKVSYIHTYCI